MIDEHAQAVLALLDADNAAPPLVVYDGKVPSGGVPPYVLVYVAARTPPAGEVPSMVDLTMDSAVVQLDIYCHSVGGNAVAARMVADRVRGALLNVRPTVSGRTCWPIRHTETVPPQRDESTGSLVMDQVDTYRLTTVPA